MTEGGRQGKKPSLNFGLFWLKLKILTSLAVIFGLFFGAGFNFASAAWQEPSSPPPQGNIAPPLNQDTQFDGEIFGNWSDNKEKVFLSIMECNEGEILTYHDVGHWECSDSKSGYWKLRNDGIGYSQGNVYIGPRTGNNAAFLNLSGDGDIYQYSGVLLQGDSWNWGLYHRKDNNHNFEIWRKDNNENYLKTFTINPDGDASFYGNLIVDSSGLDVQHAGRLILSDSDNNKTWHISNRGDQASSRNSLSFIHGDGVGGFIEGMRIDTDGNVGIGTTDPKVDLHVVDKLLINGSQPRIILGDEKDPENNLIWLIDKHPNHNDFRIFTQPGLETPGTVMMKIDTDGNVGIGTTDLLSGSGKLSVGGRDLEIGKEREGNKSLIFSNSAVNEDDQTLSWNNVDEQFEFSSDACFNGNCLSNVGAGGAGGGAAGFWDQDGVDQIIYEGEVHVLDPSGNKYSINEQDASNYSTGVAIRPESNPDSGDPLFSVQSAGGRDRLVVEHAGEVYSEYSDFVLYGGNKTNSFFQARTSGLTVGNGSDQGDIITIKGAEGEYVGTVIKSGSNEKWYSGKNDSENFVIRRNGFSDVFTIKDSDYGNVGIGKSLTAGSTHAVDDPALQLAIGDNDTGFQQQGDDQLGIFTNNVERARFDSSGNFEIYAGNLDVGGEVCDGFKNCLSDIAGASGGGFWEQDGADQIIYEGEVHVLDPSGNKYSINEQDASNYSTGVAIRPESNPYSGAPLFSVQSAGGRDRLVVEHDGEIYSEYSDFVLYEGNKTNPFFAAKRSGQVGIGTASPNANIHVYQESGNAEIDIQSGGFLDGTNHWAIYHDQGTDELRFWKEKNYSQANRLVIDNLGNLRIGQGSQTTNQDIHLIFGDYNNNWQQLFWSSANNYFKFSNDLYVSGNIQASNYCNQDGTNCYPVEELTGFWEEDSQGIYYSGSVKATNFEATNFEATNSLKTNYLVSHHDDQTIIDLSVEDYVKIDGNLMLDGNISAGGEVCDGSGNCLSDIAGASGGGFWEEHSDGIYYSNGNVGIGGVPSSNSKAKLTGYGQLTLIGQDKDPTDDDINLVFGTLGTGKQLFWDNSESRFELTDNLKVRGDFNLNSGQEIFFADNGQIRSLDNNHRILFRRDENKMEFREYGDIVFSPGSTNGQETTKMTIDSAGNLNVGGDISADGEVCDGSGNCLGSLNQEITNNLSLGVITCTCAQDGCLYPESECIPSKWGSNMLRVRCPEGYVAIGGGVGSSNWEDKYKTIYSAPVTSALNDDNAETLYGSREWEVRVTNGWFGNDGYAHFRCLKVASQ